MLGCAAALTACAPSPGSFRLEPGATLLVTRHADREGEELTAKGRRRAQALVRAVRDLPIDGLYSPGIARNLATAAPLSEARALPVIRLPQENPLPGLTKGGAGKTRIWIGNQGNIDAIWEALSLPGPAPLEYGQLAIIRSDAEGRLTATGRFYGPR